MKSQKKRVKILIASFLSMLMLANTPIWMTSIEAKPKKHKQHSSNQDDKDVVDDQSNSDSDSDNTNSNDNQQASSTDQNAENKRQWEQYLGEKNENKGQYFKRLPHLVLQTLQEARVNITIEDGSTSNEDKSLAQASSTTIRKKDTPDGSDVIVTKDQNTFSRKDVENFQEAIIEFVVEKRAEAGTLINQALLDALNEMKEKKGRVGNQGRNLLFTQPFIEHKGPFDLDFLQAHLSDVKRMVKESIAWFADPTQHILLENYAEPMWKYMQGHFTGEVKQTTVERRSNRDEILANRRDKTKARYEDGLEPRDGQENGKEQTRQIDGKNMLFTFVEHARNLAGRTQKYIMKDQYGDLWLFKDILEPGDLKLFKETAEPREFTWIGEAEVGANKLLKALGQFSVDIGSVTLDMPDKGELPGTIQKVIDLQKWGLTARSISELTDEQRKQLQQHQLIDFLLQNKDHHSGNFGVDHSGNIVAFDKGDALLEYRRYRPGDASVLALSRNLNAFNTHIYKILWNGWLENKYEMDLMAVKSFIEKIESLSDDALRDMFSAYAEGLEKQSGKSAKRLLDALVKRKNTIQAQVEAFYKQLADKKGISFEGFSSNAAQVPVDKLAS